MEITFDAIKDVVNVGKHGVSLADAEKIDWEIALIWADRRNNYGEPRQLSMLFSRIKRSNL